MSSVVRSAALAAAFLVAGIAPVPAAPSEVSSPATQAFLANLVPNVDFLDRSSRMALEHSKGRRLRAFALDEAREQTFAANAIYDWMQASARPMVASTVPPAADAGKNPTLKGKDLDRTPTGSTAAGAGTDITPDAVPAPLPPVGSADTRLPRGQEDLDSLEGLEGKAFDADYKDKQKDALQQVETDYSDYVAKGNDPTLLAIAKRELPLVRKRLAALARV